MKFGRYGEPGSEKPGLVDLDGFDLLFHDAFACP